MSRKRITIDDLSGWAREQVERKLRQNRSGSTAESENVQTTSHTSASAQVQKMRGKKRTPNKTEEDYNRVILKNNGIYEPITLRLPGGSRYTPDYMTVDGAGYITLHEVKGSYRLHSHSRALTAFRECAAAFKMFNFVWAERQKDGTYAVLFAN